MMPSSQSWFIILLLAMLALLPGCNQGYTEKNGAVYLNGKEVARNAIMLNKYFVKDSASVYFNGSRLELANQATFAALDDHYGKDDQHVYYCDTYRDGQTYYTTSRNIIELVSDADPSTFRLVGAGYAKDARHAFFHATSFSVKDLASFKGLDNSFACDRVAAYFNLNAISQSNGSTFKVINNAYARDTNNYYFYNLASNEPNAVFRLSCHVATMQLLTYPYAKDKYSVFYEHRQIKGAHAAGFSPIANGFARDESAVYFRLQKVHGADVPSFTLYPESDSYTHDNYYAKDHQTVFWQSKKLAADIHTFTPIAPGYGKDNNHVFFREKVVNEADVKTFKAYPHDLGNADAEDRIHRFKHGRIVKND